MLENRRRANTAALTYWMSKGPWEEDEDDVATDAAERGSFVFPHQGDGAADQQRDLDSGHEEDRDDDDQEEMMEGQGNQKEDAEKEGGREEEQEEENIRVSGHVGGGGGAWAGGSSGVVRKGGRGAGFAQGGGGEENGGEGSSPWKAWSECSLNEPLVSPRDDDQHDAANPAA